MICFSLSLTELLLVSWLLTIFIAMAVAPISYGKAGATPRYISRNKKTAEEIKSCVIIRG